MEIIQLAKTQFYLASFLGMDSTKPLICEFNKISIDLNLSFNLELDDEDITPAECNGWVSLWKGYCFMGRSRRVAESSLLKITRNTMDDTTVGDSDMGEFFKEFDSCVMAGKRYRELHSFVVAVDRVLKLKMEVDAERTCCIVKFVQSGDSVTEDTVVIEYELPLRGGGAKNSLAVVYSYKHNPDNGQIIWFNDLDGGVCEETVVFHPECIVGIRLMYRPSMGCNVCGQYTKTSCSNCTDVFYCCRDHQVADWKTHKHLCHPVPAYSCTDMCTDECTCACACDFDDYDST
jgi:hypothetical protein